MSWNKYNSSRFQVERYFRSNKLSQSQIDELVKILDVLSLYMIVDRDILNARSNNKIGLSHLQRAINLDLIIELKNQNELNSNFELEGNHYFYTLGFAGINLLRVDNRNYNYFPVLESFENKEKVLMLNYHILKKGCRLLFSTYNDMKYYNFFHCKDEMNQNVIFYFDEYLSINHIESIIKKIYISKLTEEQLEKSEDMFNDFISKFTFQSIEISPTNYNNKLKVDYCSRNN